VVTEIETLGKNMYLLNVLIGNMAKNKNYSSFQNSPSFIDHGSEHVNE
jgi:hypothetical protein